MVEDNPAVGRFAVATLSELGYSTVYAGDAETALAELNLDAQRFDAVFSDVVMPGMSGIDLARLLRERHPGLPVVLASGYSEVLAQEGLRRNSLLQKPYTVQQLARALARVVSTAPQSLSG